MAVGIIRQPDAGFKADLMSYLRQPSGGIGRRLAGDGAGGVVGGRICRDLLPQSAGDFLRRGLSTVRNVPVSALYLSMLVMIGLTVVAAMRLWAIMVIAMLTIPPAVAGLFLKDMKGMMLLSIGLSWLFSALGLLVSFTLNLQAGSVIILVAALSYLAAAGIKKLTTRPMA